MSGISYTAPTFSEHDEKRERADLTEKEKIGIKNDIYGNDGEHTTDDENITEDLLDRFDLELESIPIEEKTDYLNALIEVPDIVETESNPTRFLRCTKYDAKVAALRLVKYWEMRCDIFLDRAFEPMTLKGAMKDEIDILYNTMLSVPSENLARVLPNDAHGRTVVCLSRSNRPAKEVSQKTILRIFWYIVHVALQSVSAQRKGVVFIIINKSNRMDFVNINVNKQMVKSISESLPLKVCSIHWCCSSLINKLRVPAVKLFMPREIRQRTITHMNTSVVNELETFGLNRNHLPKSIGGNYDEPPDWLNKCRRLIDNRRRRNKRNRQRRMRDIQVQMVA